MCRLRAITILVRLYCLESTSQTDHHGSARIEQVVRRIRELLVRAPLLLVDVDYIDGQLGNPRRETKHLAEVEAGREVPLRVVVAEQLSAEHARLIAVRAAALRTLT